MWLADVLAGGGRVLGGGVGEDEDVVGFYQFFLDSRWRDEDVVVSSNGCLKYQ